MKDVITRSQALAAGITHSAQRHRLRTGRWQVVFRGVYLTRSGSPSWRQRLEAATLARGAGTVASLDCALNLWGLTDREPPVLTLAEPATTRRSAHLPGVRVRRRARLSVARRYGIPVTSAAQTILDVLALPGRRLDDDIALITRAVSRRRVSVEALRAELRHHPRHPRRAALEEILAAAAEGLGSVAEVRYVERVERPHGLPTMARQVPMDGPEATADGRTRRMDFKDEARGVVVEIDGELYHRYRQAQDRGRDRETVGRGEVTLRAGWAEVAETPCELAVDVALALRARGWTGRPTPCGPTCAVGRDVRLRRPPGRLPQG
ncbi:type IV toxin-antitoxin system AbiEi family antitoxin domain-containing protein [Ornithinimicrobium avium]|uniref:Transcriptional regulator, AbiEi antitoxin, Type IV TA system n=1 Tax=Ornithinimicrobium avium TaxID=2283195 RepID=A0A345NMY2_9MICO|nr:hypothetical protein [Ornithinimicrobium avium]AXH96390.1 hypothetical protein DV701_09900 [Ornithinimicrobium avium]